jgi:deoxyhypusine synthase
MKAPKSQKSDFLKSPVEPLVPEVGLTGDALLERMERISFQGRNLALARRVWERMLSDDVTVFLGLAGALSAGGLRLVVADLITSRTVDCVVTTGANLYHDLHEIRGRRHYLGSPRADDSALQRAHIDRVYDTYADEEEFVDNDEWIAEFTLSLEQRPHTSRELANRLGERLWQEYGRHGILTAAYLAQVPVFCPAIADSSIGMGLAQARHRDPRAASADVVGDIVESANVVLEHTRTASVVLGGGTPKNFINQASVEAEYYNPAVGGHRYAVQIVTDAPHFGGASGSSLHEAESWGKVAGDAQTVTVHADVTIALPLLATALLTSATDLLAARQPPAFTPGGRTMTMNGRDVSAVRFEPHHE